MKKWIGLLLVMLLLGTAIPLMGCAEEEVEKEAYASASIMSNYVWRGQKLSDSVVLQPNAGLSYNGFGFDLPDGQPQASEGGNGLDTPNGRLLVHAIIGVRTSGRIDEPPICELSDQPGRHSRPVCEITDSHQFIVPHGRHRTSPSETGPRLRLER